MPQMGPMPWAILYIMVIAFCVWSVAGFLQSHVEVDNAEDLDIEILCKWLGWW